MGDKMVESDKETRNINVEVEFGLYIELRKMALDRKLEFHDFIRLLFQKEVYEDGTDNRNRKRV